MLMIFLMAVWALNLFPHTVEDAINMTQRLPPRHNRKDGSVTLFRTSSERFNSAILTTFPTSTTTSMSIPLDMNANANHNFTVNLITSSPPPTNSLSKYRKLAVHRSQRENATQRGRVRTLKRKKSVANRKSENATVTSSSPKTWIRGNNSKHISRSEHDLLPKSNMQVLQFYAQPLNPIELNAQSLPTTFTGSSSGGAVQELSVLMKPTNSETALSHSHIYMAPSSFPMNPVNSLTYKTIPEEFLNSAESLPKTLTYKPINYNVGLERPALNPLPILAPYNVHKRNPRPVPIMPIQPQKFVATIRPVSASSPRLPPVSVTRVYKYTEDGSPAFKLPFLDSDDPIDESLPILSAALDDRLNDRIASINVRNYMTPPKLSQPIVYGSGTHAPVTLPDVYRNEFPILNKYNENLRIRAGRYHTGKPQSFKIEDDEAENDKENYSEEEVKKALKYIQRLKKIKSTPDRGSATFITNEQHFRNLKRKPKEHQNKKEHAEDDFDNDDTELEPISDTDKRKRKKEEHDDDPFRISDDDDNDSEDTGTAFQVKSSLENVDRNQEESRRKTVKANAEDKPKSVETRQVPSVHEMINEHDSTENADLGIENDGDDRVEFQMHGLGGAESYKFGYDTGKGENRQFRYEERDGNGKVKGHYGYYDRDGKLQLFNYEADPEHGYHLEKAAEH